MAEKFHKKELLKSLIQKYIFLNLLIKEQLNINEFILNHSNYINLTNETFKIHSLSLENNKYNFKKNNNSILFFDEMENAKIIDLNHFIEIYQKIESIILKSKNYNDLNINYKDLSFDHLIPHSNIDLSKIKLVLSKNDIIYNKTFEIGDPSFILKNHPIYSQSVSLLIENKLESNFINSVKKYEKNILKNLKFSTNNDLYSLLSLYYIKYNINNLLDFYKKICFLNPYNVNKNKIKTFYQKEMEIFLLNLINEFNLKNIIFINKDNQQINLNGIITDNKNNYNKLSKYKISLNFNKSSILHNKIKMKINISFFHNDKKYLFLKNCQKVNKELVVLYSKLQPIESSSIYKQYFSV